jgi:hypothetical protein
VSGVKLGLCCSRPEAFHQGLPQSSLENALEFSHFSRSNPFLPAEPLSLARLDAGAADLEQSIHEAVENEVTHILFLSYRALLPFYSIEKLLSLPVSAASGISWTWMPGQAGETPEVFPRVGYFDPEGRPYPYFGWSAPGLFEVEWCGLDCLLLSREALEGVAAVMDRVRGREPALRISQCLRSCGIPILVDSSVQCPRVVSPWGPQIVPSEDTWREFSSDGAGRRVPLGRHYDPSYRGRAWYREWVSTVVER